MKRDNLTGLPIINGHNGAKMRGPIQAHALVMTVRAGVFQEVSSLTAGAGAGKPGEKYGKLIETYESHMTVFLEDLREKKDSAFDHAIDEAGREIVSAAIAACVRDGYFPKEEFERYAAEKAERRRAQRLQAGAEGDPAAGERTK